MGQAIEVQATTQVGVEVEPVITPMVEELATSKLTVDLVDVGPAAATLQKAATTTERNPSPNPKKNPVIVLEEEV